MTRAQQLHHSIRLFKRHAIALGISLAPVLASADKPLFDHQQWQCSADVNGEWSCREQQSIEGPYPQLEKPTPRLTQKNQTQQENNSSIKSEPYQQWDWVAKSAMTNPEDCETGCDGDYVEPVADWPDANLVPDKAALRAEADSSKAEEQTVIFEGDVTITQGYRQLKAEKAILDRNSQNLSATGPVEIREPDLLLRAQEATINTESGTGQFQQGRFLQHSTGTRVEATLIKRTSANTLDLEDAKFTQCTPDDEVWAFNANTIHLDQNEGWGSAKHARLNIQDIPVFYVPYMTFPIDNRRKTGFLWPSFGSSGDGGFELSTPYYLNLAPNYDATITPRYISDRGTMAEVELRHMNVYSELALSGALLENDDTFEESPSPTLTEEELNDIPDREKRWLGAVDHKARLGKLSSSIDYTKVSDIDYLRDLSVNSLEVKRTTHLNQQAKVNYLTPRWLISANFQQRQTLDDDLNSQYKLMPRIEIERNSDGANFQPEWIFSAEFTDFDHDQSIEDGGTFVTGNRTYSEGGISYPMRWIAGYIIPTAKVRHVTYQLDETVVNADDHLSATTPLATLDMGLIFERDTEFGDSQFIQTLEPRLYYFYSDYESDQSLQPNFDTTELTFSYSQLYRDTRFSGNDRLDDANQLSLGVSSRFIEEESGREIVTLSIGQIFYFDDRKVQIFNGTTPNTVDNSFIASEVQYQPQDNIWVKNTLLWNSRNDTLQEGGISAHYQTKGKSLYNLGYRFRRNGDSNLLTGVQDLEQADASLLIPITEKWTLYSRLQYDITEQSSIDSLAGLQYEDCCWMVRLLYQEGFDDEFIDALNNKVVVENDYAFIIEFQLKGLGSLGNKANNILKESILGYEDIIK